MDPDDGDKRLYQQSIKDTLINTKDAVFSIVDDTTKGGIKKEYFTKNNRLYYIGVLLIILVIIFMIYNSFIYESSDKQASFIIKLEK